MLQITSLDQLDQTRIDELQAQLTTLLQEELPGVELRRGTVHDVVLRVAAVLEAASQDNIDRWQQAGTLYSIQQNPAAVSDELVDQKLQDYRIFRTASTPATGYAFIVLSSPATTSIPAGAVFSAGDQNYEAVAATVARASAAELQGLTEQVLTALGNNRYGMSVKVRAKVAGSGGLLRRGALLEPQFSIPAYLTSYAENDFEAGQDGQTNADLVSLALRGLAPTAWSNRASIEAALAAKFPGLLAVSIIGHGDPEMGRDDLTIFPVSVGGRSDLYVRTSRLPRHITTIKRCVLVDKTPEGGIWQTSFTRGEGPGFYRVESVAQPSADPLAPGYQVVSDVRGLDLTGTGFRPDIQDPLDAAYSAFQTATIQFLDQDTLVHDLAVFGAEADYRFVVSAMPDLRDLQEWAGGREMLDPGGDTLVRAAIPCFVSVHFDIHHPVGSQISNLDVIQADLADAVNQLGFAGHLHASLLSDLVQSRLPRGCYAGAIHMFGRIRRPDGSVAVLRSDDFLQVPAEPARRVTARTVAFFLDPADVRMTLIPLTSG